MRGADVIVNTMETIHKDNKEFQQQYLAILNRVYPAPVTGSHPAAVVPSTNFPQMGALSTFAANANISETDKQELATLFAAINKIINK